MYRFDTPKWIWSTKEHKLRTHAVSSYDDALGRFVVMTDGNGNLKPNYLYILEGITYDRLIRLRFICELSNENTADTSTRSFVLNPLRVGGRYLEVVHPDCVRKIVNKNSEAFEKFTILTVIQT